MKNNMGKADRIIRILLAIAIIGLYLSGNISGMAAIILLIFAAVFIATSIISFCPLYLPFNIKTNKTK